MKYYYYKIKGRNGWCGCDEDFYLKTSYSPTLMEDYFEDVLASCYSFFEGDARFFDDDLSEEEKEDAYYGEVMSNSSFEEISEEEYLEAVENGENIIEY